ncbi:CMRF35-like molecule 8 isoform X3 [Meles meles]|uniref:CMRF35-like molecule 8 isoform X3 n=1 Tax=Meles meles TaxID=9662 RepID=UPI001E69EE35|nr:CMRF35-like molecule 8 isoform X3 [Meles meles]
MSVREGIQRQCQVLVQEPMCVDYVTLESLTEDDAGTYQCGIDTSVLQGYLLDLTFPVVLSVDPATTPAPPLSIAVTQMSTTTAKITTAPSPPSSAAPTSVGATCSASSQEEFPPSQGRGLQVLLSLFAFLLLLLGGSLLLAWRMVRRRVKSGENPKQLQSPSQQGEPYYANLELQTWPLREEPMHPRQPEVEYSTVKAPREEPYYSTVVFDFQSGDSTANSIRSQRTLEEETQYSVIKKI